MLLSLKSIVLFVSVVCGSEVKIGCRPQSTKYMIRLEYIVGWPQINKYSFNLSIAPCGCDLRACNRNHLFCGDGRTNDLPIYQHESLIKYLVLLVAVYVCLAKKKFGISRPLSPILLFYLQKKCIMRIYFSFGCNYLAD